MTPDNRPGLFSSLIHGIVRLTTEPYEDALVRTRRVYMTEVSQQEAFRFTPHLPTHVSQQRNLDLLGGLVRLPFPPRKTIFQAGS